MLMDEETNTLGVSPPRTKKAKVSAVQETTAPEISSSQTEDVEAPIDEEALEAFQPKDGETSFDKI